MIGTAGHIDHGKTALVRLLTGCETDTLAEERQRGLTINLGFAPCRLADNSRVGIVDVPGHEKFIKNMVAGAAGIDMVLLVVAADDGVMPQTREHLSIVELLGVKKGLIAVTKIDMVEGEMAELVIEELKDYLKGTFLEGAPICPVSSISGEGYDGFYHALNDMVSSINPREISGVFRLPVERAFTLKGYGTVATGIPFSGRVAVGDTLELVPGTKKCRVRGMQVYNEMANEGFAGQCVALNITDLSQDDFTRGMSLVTPGYFEPTPFIAARLKLLDSCPVPVKNRTPVRFHTGTAEVMGRVILLDHKTLEPGDEALVQLRLDEQQIVGPGDHYIIRLNSPLVTVGGGVILGGGRRRLKQFKEWIIEDLIEKESAISNETTFVEHLLKEERYVPQRGGDLAKKANLPRERITEIIDELHKTGRIARIGNKDLYVHILPFENLEQKVLDILRDFHQHKPVSLGMSRIDVRKELKLDSVLLDEVVNSLISSGTVIEEAKSLRLSDFKVALDGKRRKLKSQIEEKLQTDLFKPNSPEDLANFLKTSPKIVGELLALSAQERTLIELDGIFFHTDSIEEARNRLVEHLKKEEKIGAASFRDLLGTTRKFSYALLEHFDLAGVTVRIENLRYLKGAGPARKAEKGSE
jgi:selenocysteine-specific elongation factor